MALLFLRHGSVPENAGDPALPGDYFRGWSQTSLSPTGVKSIQQTSDWLKNVPLAGIVHSDLPRAAQTAAMVSQATGVPATPDPRLRPLNVGQLTGLEITPERKKLMDEGHRNLDMQFPGGESYNQFVQRYSQALPDLVNASQDKNILVITHHRNILSLPYIFFGKKPQSEGPPAPGGIVALTQKGLQTIFEPSTEQTAAYKREAVS